MIDEATWKMSDATARAIVDASGRRVTGQDSPCPACRARSGTRCTTPEGIPTVAHEDRWRAVRLDAAWLYVAYARSSPEGLDPQSPDGVVSPYGVACPECGESAGNPCISGPEWTGAHSGRDHAAHEEAALRGADAARRVLAVVAEAEREG